MGRKRSSSNKHLPPRFTEKHGAYYHVYYVDGRKRWHRLSKDYTEALRLYYEREAGELPRVTTFGDMVKHWQSRTYPTLKPRTIEEYDRAVRFLTPVFDKAPIDQIQPVDIAKYMDRRSSQHSANKEKAVMSSVFEFAIRWGYRKDNPARAISYHRTKRRKRIITVAEWKQIQLAAPNDLVPCFMDLAYATGLRVSDLLALKWSAIEGGMLSVDPAKTDNLDDPVKAAYTVTPALESILERAKWLHRWRADYVLPPMPDAPIIGKRNADHYTRSGFHTMWRRVVLKAGIPDVCIHDIRRTAITDAKRQRGSAQEFSLHKTPSEADAYVVEGRKVVIPLEVETMGRGTIPLESF